MTVERELPVLDVELIAVDGVPVEQLAPQPLAYPPAAREQVSCRCGKRSIDAHGGFSCDAVLAIGARVSYSQLPFWRRWRAPKPAGWRLSREEIEAIRDRDRARREALCKEAELMEKAAAILALLLGGAR
jgi:hypothetical protein